MPITLPRIRAINAVANGGSYAAAARQLGLSQPAVSQHVRDTEAEYGVRLFLRRNGALHPTPLCAQLCDIAERMAGEEREAERILTRHTTLLDGRLSIGLGNSMPGMAVIALFRKRHPSVSVSVETGSFEKIVKAVLAREVDVGVLPDLPADGRFRTELLVRQDVVAVVHAQNSLAERQSFTCAQLMEAPLIFRTRGSSTQRVVDRAFRAARFEPAPILMLDTRDAAYEAVANGLGVGFMWRHGTGRTDAVRRIPVREMNRMYDEAAFTLADEQAVMVDAFMAAVRAFRAENAQQE
ncbi:LysR substrate-binding domain-containing protein [Nitratireductor pacificus]|uniref:LysR family transcriptional regulator n=1 Tax=Nitratireductor pacificus pht-3B TaxID=391937 RepID=K2LHX5_9HYPH|nr:LysR substrate-binding domain-containing protein [Nitratireductor pacificus]EKF17349.1 LysR family transcriptional regulator [Nitratireductor pacificus pht-3B]